MSVQYHANFRSKEPRSSRPSNTITFFADSDGEASAVVAELGNWTTGKNTSITKNVGGVGTGDSYPTGTRITVTAHVVGQSGAIARVRFRNVKDGVSDDDIVALLTGVAGPSGSSFPVVALGSAPTIPGTDDPIVSVSSVTFLNKP